jgi:anti-sigma factor RsiW
MLGGDNSMTVDCAGIQDALLDLVDEPGTPATRQAIDAHLAGCPACAAFAARQRALDLRLLTELRAPSLSASFRPALRQRIRHERVREWFEALPDLVHIGGCTVATCASALLLPVDAVVVLGAGATMTIASYAMMAALRSALDDSDR